MSSSLLIPLLALAVYCAGAMEFMLSPMLDPLAAAFSTTLANATWLIAAYALAYALAAPLFGYCSDRMDRRRIVLAALLLFALDGLALTLAPSLLPAAILRLLGGCAAALLIPGIFALVADTLPPQKQTAAIGHIMLGMTLGISTGPALAGILTATLSWQAPFLLNAGGCIMVFLLAGKAIPPPPVRRTEPPTIPPSMLPGNKAILLPLASKACWNGAAVTAFMLSGEILRQEHSIGTAGTGLILSAFGIGLGVGNLATGYITPRFRRKETLLLLAVAVMTAVITLFMLTGLSRTATMACLLCWGICLGMAAPVSTFILASRSGNNKGFVLSLSESLNNGVIIAVLPLCACLLAASGRAAAVSVLAGTLALGWSLCLMDARRCQYSGHRED